MDEHKRSWQKLPWIKITVVAVVLLAVLGALLLWRPETWGDIQDFLPDRYTPPWLFITLMLIIPLIGGPIGIFFIIAGVVLGTWTAFAVSAGVIAFHTLFAYWVAHGFGRTVVLRVLNRFHYEPPEIPDRHMLKVAVTFFAMPGLPYAVKGYLFAMTNVPFLLYFLTAFSVNMLYAFVLISLGGAAAKARWTILAVIVVLLVIAHFATKLIQSRRSSNNESRETEQNDSNVEV